MLVSTDLFAVFHASLENKVCIDSQKLRPFFIRIWRLVARVKRSQKRLDDMIAVNVCRKFQNVRVEMLDQKQYFWTKVLYLAT